MVSFGSISHATDLCSYYFKSKEYDRAIEECTGVINSGTEKGDSLYEYYATRGLIYKIRGQYDEALSDYNNAVESGTDNNVNLSFTYNDRGNVYESTGQYDQAMSDYHRAIEQNPDSYVAMYNMAGLFSLMNNAEPSCKWLKKSIKKGFSIGRQVIRREKKFNNIRNSSCFREIMAGK
jgi:tetratricopeptide (TPR) repeat protein